MDFWRICIKLRNDEVKQRMEVSDSTPERIGKKKLQWEIQQIAQEHPGRSVTRPRSRRKRNSRQQLSDRVSG